MKTRLASLLALVVALSASALAAPSPATATVGSAFAFNVNYVRQGNGAEIERGTTQMTVLRLMGPAQRELAPDVWVYTGYRPEVGPANGRGCDTLLITFTDGRVSDLKIVNTPAATIIAAKLKSFSDVVQIAKK